MHPHFLPVYINEDISELDAPALDIIWFHDMTDLYNHVCVPGYSSQAPIGK